MPSETLLEKAKKLQLNPDFSQNFLVDETILKKIASACEPSSTEIKKIVEIGPGAGYLTEQLLKLGLETTVVELDERFAQLLDTQFGTQIKIINQNVLKVDVGRSLEPKGVLVGNLPYHLTSPILFHTLGEMDDPEFKNRSLIDKAIFMVQLEVADRLCAKPKQTGYSQLSLQIQYWYEAEFLFKVPKGCFHPAPKVNSAVVMLKPRAQGKVPVENLTRFSKLIKTSFLHRRKTLLNNLKLANIQTQKPLAKIIEEAGLAANQRPEELSLEDFARLDSLIYLT